MKFKVTLFIGGQEFSTEVDLLGSIAKDDWEDNFSTRDKDEVLQEIALKQLNFAMDVVHID